MAIKQKTDSKISRIGQYLKEEHKWENYVFLALCTIVLVLGTLILTDVLTVKKDFPIIGEFGTQFAWIITIFSGLGLIYALYPFFRPAWPELKKVSWLKPKAFLGNSIRTFIFIIVLALLFFLYDAFIYQIFERLL